MKKNISILISSAFALTGCTGMTTPTQLSFDTLSVEKRVTLTTDTNSPAYEMKINVKYVKEGSDDMRKSVNDAITAKIFNLHNVDIKMAVDSFVNENTRTYLKDMRPLYMEDKRDIDRRPIYEYAADIKTRTEDGREGVVTYFIDMYNFEGGAHGLTQLLTLNFDKATGKTLTLDDVMVPGYKVKLNDGQGRLQGHQRAPRQRLSLLYGDVSVEQLHFGQRWYHLHLQPLRDCSLRLGAHRIDHQQRHS